jgi:hypothetical protein
MIASHLDQSPELIDEGHIVVGSVLATPKITIGGELQ